MRPWKGRLSTRAGGKIVAMTKSPAMKSAIVQNLDSKRSINKRCVFVVHALSYKGAFLIWILFCNYSIIPGFLSPTPTVNTS